jgi:hypothetical protein
MDTQQEQTKNVDLLFGALDNDCRRAIILYIGDHGGKVKGWDDMIHALKTEGYTNRLKSTIGTFLSKLKHRYGILTNQDGVWAFTELGKQAYELLNYHRDKLGVQPSHSGGINAPMRTVWT